jgi:hypothetical protein
MSGNRFRKAEERERVAPGGGTKPPSKEDTVDSLTNPLAGMIEPKPEGKTYGFYLSAEAAEKLENLAKQNKCSKSKALDTLLRNL